MRKTAITPRPRSTIAEARQRRYLDYLASTCPDPPHPTKRELGALTPRQWRYQFRAQHGRCGTCMKIARPRYRRLSADRFGKIHCLKCWWGQGNVEVGAADTQPGTYVP